MYNGNRVGGVNESALESIYSIFPETRLILKQYGFLGKQFANLAFEMLNDVIRPFTTKWHRHFSIQLDIKFPRGVFVCVCNFFIFIHCAYPFLVVQFL
jgi:hypothetical protein